MINVSGAFLARMQRRRDFRCCADITLADGSSLYPTDADLVIGGSGFTDGAGLSSFPIGCAIERHLTLELINDKDQYANVDFLGASVHLRLSFAVSDFSTERIDLGYFTVTEPETYGETVVITAVDGMWRADRPYVTRLPFPATLTQIFRDVCDTCGIAYATADFPNSAYTVGAAPEGDYTCREIIGFVAMLAGGNARINRSGLCEIIPYGSGGGVTLPAWINLRADTDDTVITGVSAAVRSDDADGGTVLCGEPGYVLALKNPLFAGNERTAVSLIGERLVGITLRRFRGEMPAFPLAEFMDPVRVTDRRGRTFSSVITDVKFTFAGPTVLSCSIESPVRQKSSYSSPNSDVVTETRRLVERERTAREQAVERLAKTLADSSGLYITVEEQPDGSGVYYMHNKPTLDGSDIVWKLTAEAFGISTDGGKTYPYGFAVTGELVTRLLYAEGINADYIDTGAITVRDADGNIVFSVNVDTGDVIISGDHVRIGGRSAAQAVGDAQSAAAAANETANQALDEARRSTALSIILSNDYEGIPTDHKGNYTGALSPSPSTAVTVLYGHTDVSADCTYSTAKSAGVTGSWNGAARTYTVTGLSTDTGWVDITARYVTFTVTKRFNVAKVRGGTPGAKGDQGESGQNLIRGTNTVAKLTSTGVWKDGTWRAASGGAGTRESIAVTDCPNPSVTLGWRLTRTDGSLNIAQVDIPVINGQTYTMSCYARGAGSLRLQYGKSPYIGKSYALENAGAWTRYAFTFTVGAGQDGSAGGSTNVYFGNVGNGTLEMCGMKLEAGGIEADKTVWVPAQQDLVGPQGVRGPKGDQGESGQNLIRGTNTVAKLTSTGIWKDGTWRAASGGAGTRESIAVTDCPIPSVTLGWRLTQTDGNLDIAQNAVPVINGQTYTLSCYARGTGKLRLQFGKSQYVVKTYPLADAEAWTRYAFTFTIGAGQDGSTDGSTHIYFGNSGVGALEICGMKLEAGEIEAGKTVWVPAQQDLEARTYSIELSANVLRRGQDLAVTPATLTAKAYCRDGQSTARAAYAGQWQIATSTDGVSFTTVATSGDADSYSYSVGGLDASIVAVRFTLFASGGVTNQLDMQTAPIVIDVDALTHEDIFNLLTKGGAMQGIYQEGGNLYINGAYIKAGTVAADKLKVGSLSAISADLGTVTAGVIQSANYSAHDATGMKLSLSDGSWSSANLHISSKGEITASAGHIGGPYGWTIKSGAIYSSTTSMTSTVVGTYIGTDGIRCYSANDKYVNIKSGVLTATGANITGTITATSGSFKGSLDAQGFIIGGSWDTGNYTTMMNNLGYCITGASQSYDGGRYRGWILRMNSSGALVAVPALYVRTGTAGTWYTQDANEKVLASPWAVQSGGGSNAGGGGGGRLPSQVTFG